ncbi:hypothetical protein K402DRAFT_452915 [Aulographum hederae CBS 113979]|uniref:Uncharacterized protein n=1 Tax=Aulographum hederae CBS 113979 TaxID=1176131 RepID=A0A6G1H592_9PEZI|nr:hypothetical protein K402DRAFT_452915 [Aulographum hederae CBS 113979]
MSGNPFRRSQAPNNPSTAWGNHTNHDSHTADEAATRFPALDTCILVLNPNSNTTSSAVAAPPARIKKVRISSPPRSPPLSSTPYSEDDEYSSPTYPKSPPFFKTSFGVDAGADSFERDAASESEGTEDEELARNTRQNSIGLNSEEQPDKMMSVSGVPRNPFSRTLANMEPSAGATVQQNASGSKENQKPAMDVDAFTRMLMTGHATPTPPENHTAGATNSQKSAATLGVDSSSSTDTSSISRQSVFDHPHELHPESPRTSYERTSFDDDDRAKLMGDGPKPPKKKPPPPQRHHGKAVVPKGPQTVSFSDFEPSVPPPIQAPVGGNAALRPHTLHRTPSDLNKPLPPPPDTPTESGAPELADMEQQHSSKPLPAPTTTETDTQPQPQPQSPMPPPPSSSKRTAPTPPLARRQSQLRSTASNSSPAPRSRSNTASSYQDLDQPNSYPPSLAESTSSVSGVKTAPPPPPPARRGGAGGGSLAGSSHTPAGLDLGSSSSTQTASATGSGIARSPSTSIKSPPIPPASRRLSSSQRSSPASIAPAIVSPPPPPPPRRASGRSSLDGTGRGSLELSRQVSAGSRRESREVKSAGVVEQRGEDAGRGEGEGASEGADGKDILADMLALQREVDALRGRYGSGEKEDEG